MAWSSPTRSAAETVLCASWNNPPSSTDLVAAAIAWHFDPETGSPYWLRRSATLGFDPRDIHTVDDLERFPDVSSEWRSIPVTDLIPRGCRGGPPPLVFESGGVTGPPKRIVELGFWRRMVHWLSRCLDNHEVPDGGNWLYLGPTGPHIAGFTFSTLAAWRGGVCFPVDFDARWARRLASGALDDYLAHVLEQASWVLADQSIQVLWATQPVLAAIGCHEPLADLVRDRVDTIVWSGNSSSAETLRRLEREIFPEQRLVGVYGNTLMGVAPQRPRRAGERQQCVFQPYYPYTILDVLDPVSGRRVEVGERGRVRLHHLTSDLFLPNVIERDVATRIAPVAGGPGGDGIADVRCTVDPVP